jgi:hypothetical protein
MIMCLKTSQKDVSKTIYELGDFGAVPDAMEGDPEAKLFFKQFDVDYTVKGTGTSIKAAKRLSLNLYFDPVRKGRELMELEIAVTLQMAALDELLNNQMVLNDSAAIKRDYNYFKVERYPATMSVKSFALNEEKVRKDKAFSDFFGIMTLSVDFDAMETYRTYRLRDEQEKCFQQMKDQMVSDRQRDWSEEGKTGRLLILFVALIMSSYVRHV